MAGRDGQSQDVADDTAVASGDGSGHLEHRGREDRLGRDEAAQRGQPTLVVGLGGAGEDEAVEVLPGEPDLDAHPGRDGESCQIHAAPLYLPPGGPP